MGPATLGGPCGGTESPLLLCGLAGRPTIPREQLREVWRAGGNVLEFGIVGRVIIEPLCRKDN
jgi:hypothetical protein